ncbi:MAG TPA: BON domain-containing protein [Denitromonas sp.]|nr:BON domain-containing protein [Denitromonas sp.]
MLKSAEINVATFKGVVQLSGFVSSRVAATRAVEVARGVGGRELGEERHADRVSVGAGEARPCANEALRRNRK